ncbi:MAG: hypothetical protein ABSF15_00625 [Candidatus Sulfotelmatobacter sp.]|jgi:uncharacterized membrane protein
MEKIIPIGRFLFGIAIAAFGVENLICARLGLMEDIGFGKIIDVIPWVPPNAFLTYSTGIALLGAGLCVAMTIKTRQGATLLGIVFILFLLLLEYRVGAKALSFRTIAFEMLAICGSALTLAGSISNPKSNGARRNALDVLVTAGPYLFGVSSVVFGIDHFIFLRFVASLVPAWLPGGLFWASFTGAAFVAAGISILIKRMDRWAGLMLGTMFLIWFLILHSPRVVIAFHSHNPNAPNECSSAFIALGMCGGSWICAWHAQHGRGGIPSR